MLYWTHAFQKTTGYIFTFFHILHTKKETLIELCLCGVGGRSIEGTLKLSLDKTLSLGDILSIDYASEYAAVFATMDILNNFTI